VSPIPADKTLSAMLDDGEIDALYTAHMPSSFARGSPNVRRLFKDHAEVEKAYFRKTGIFPIMHTVVVRADVYERSPWVMQSLTKAFEVSKQRAYADLFETTALKLMLPWLTAQAEEARELLGTDDFWPYGLEPNRQCLSTFLRYSFEQGLSSRLLAPEELFAPETLESSRI
jgi:4,5-dihydroxyphthalate decarboxylase